MKAINRTTTRVQENVQALDVAGKVTVSLFGGASLLIGIWAMACFAGALIATGPLGLVKAYFSALTGL
jgi:hypothetical protein